MAKNGDGRNDIEKKISTLKYVRLPSKVDLKHTANGCHVQWSVLKMTEVQTQFFSPKEGHKFLRKSQVQHALSRDSWFSTIDSYTSTLISPGRRHPCSYARFKNVKLQEKLARFSDV